MEWNEIEEFKPRFFERCLVATFIEEEDRRDYFVGYYNDQHHTWDMLFHFKGKFAPHVNIERAILPKDKWSYFDSCNDE